MALKSLFSYPLSSHRSSPKPLRLLLYVEWLLLSMGALVSITATLLDQTLVAKSFRRKDAWLLPFLPLACIYLHRSGWNRT